MVVGGGCGSQEEKEEVGVMVVTVVVKLRGRLTRSAASDLFALGHVFEVFYCGSWGGE